MIGSGPLEREFDFFVTVVDPCETTTLSFDPAVADMVGYVNLGLVEQVVLAKDSASSTYGDDLDGYSFCGARSYTIDVENTANFYLEQDTLKL